MHYSIDAEGKKASENIHAWKLKMHTVKVREVIGNVC